MKLLASLAFTLVTLLGPLNASEIVAGPKGGRLLNTEPNRAEFFVNASHHAEITFYDDALKPVAPTTQSVRVTAEIGSERKHIDLEKTPQGFVSKKPLPRAATPYRIVLQVRSAPEAKPANFRVDLNLTVCGECNRAEYACTCAGH